MLWVLCLTAFKRETKTLRDAQHVKTRCAISVAYSPRKIRPSWNAHCKAVFYPSVYLITQ